MNSSIEFLKFFNQAVLASTEVVIIVVAVFLVAVVLIVFNFWSSLASRLNPDDEQPKHSDHPHPAKKPHPIPEGVEDVEKPDEEADK